jgi:hypothetical protein
MRRATNGRRRRALPGGYGVGQRQNQHGVVGGKAPGLPDGPDAGCPPWGWWNRRRRCGGWVPKSANSGSAPTPAECAARLNLAAPTDPAEGAPFVAAPARAC